MTLTQPAPLHLATPEITEDDIAAVVAVLRSGWLTTGSVAEQFEQALAAEVGAAHVVATSSCTTALETALAALRLPAGSPVAVPAWTFVSTVTVLLRLGLVPVLVDADPATLNLSVDSLERAVAHGARAVVPVHFAGAPVDPAVFALARAAGLPVVEDSAHALGARLPAGRGAVAGCYSFYATKNLTCAEGGALATDDAEVAAFARAYRLHGMSKDAWRRYEPGAEPTYELMTRGTKANLPDLLAALGLSQLRRFADMQQRRRALVTRYRELLAELPPDVVGTPLRDDPDSADHLFVVLLPEDVDRGSVARHLGEHGVGVSVHFRPVHHFAVLRPELDTTGGLPVCDAVWPRALSLPLHPGMQSDDVDRVVQCLAEATARARRSRSHVAPATTA